MKLWIIRVGYAVIDKDDNDRQISPDFLTRWEAKGFIERTLKKVKK